MPGVGRLGSPVAERECGWPSEPGTGWSSPGPKPLVLDVVHFGPLGSCSIAEPAGLSYRQLGSTHARATDMAVDVASRSDLERR